MSSHLLHSLIHYWADAFPLDVPTLYPGMVLKTENLPAWLELWLDAWSDPPHRHATSPPTSCLATIHCFTRPSASLTQCHTLADAASTTLARQFLPIRDFSASGTPVLGHLSLYEPETRSLTRTTSRAVELPLQHLVITIPGRVHPLMETA